MSPSSYLRPALSHGALAAIGTAMFLGLTGSALAASSWNPTLLVNTESFQTIDEGNGTSDIEIRFGQTLQEKLYYDRANSRFVFSRGLLINGDTKVRGNLSGSTLSIDGAASILGATTIGGNAKVRGNLSGATLNVDGTSTFTGGVTAGSTMSVGGAATFGSTVTVTGNTKVRGNLSGATLNVDGNATIVGNVTADGTIGTKGNATINSDNDTNDATLTFGNATAAQTIKFSNANQRFELSKGLKVNGNMSGSTLNVDGTVTFKNIGYSFPNAQGAANTYLKNDGTGTLSWATVTNGNSSGSFLSFHPEYPNAAYFGSGSTTVGTLTRDYDTTNKENFYRWTTSQGSAQDYWIAVRVKVPKNFAAWANTPIQFRYRTHTTSSASNYVTVRLLDTAGANVAISGGSALVSGTADTWATASITNVSGGTYTADGFITVLIKMASTSAGWADAGYLNINWSTTTP